MGNCWGQRLKSKTRFDEFAKELDEYRERDGNALLDFAAELLQEFGYNRFNCPHVFLIVIANSKDNWPISISSVLNGGYNTGGGATMMSTDVFTKKPNAQSTLEHELGHTFGLPHVDAYGIEMTGNNPSLMSYNQAHWTRGFEPSLQPAAMIPKDIRGLALNNRLIPNLEFSSTKDVPDGYKLFSGPQFRSHPSRWMASRIIPSKSKAMPDPHSIRKSKAASSVIFVRVQRDLLRRRIDVALRTCAENVTLDLTFPFPVELTKIRSTLDTAGNTIQSNPFYAPYRTLMELRSCWLATR